MADKKSGVVNFKDTGHIADSIRWIHHRDTEGTEVFGWQGLSCYINSIHHPLGPRSSQAIGPRFILNGCWRVSVKLSDYEVGGSEPRIDYVCSSNSSHLKFLTRSSSPTSQSAYWSPGGASSKTLAAPCLLMPLSGRASATKAQVLVPLATALRSMRCLTRA